MESPKRPTAIDLFCGAGGMSLGFEQAGFDVAAAFDIDHINICTHKKNFPRISAAAVNLSKQTGESLAKKGGFQCGEIDVVFGGPPCQGFSVAGTRNPEDERNLLVYDFARLIRQISPKYFVMENVNGLLSEYSKTIINSFMRRVRRSGYEVVAPVRILNAADFGVPQRRLRTFVLGYRKDLPVPTYPDGKSRQVSVRQAIGDLPSIERCDDLYSQDRYYGDVSTAKSDYARRLRGELLDRNDFSRKRDSRSSGLSG